MALGTSLIVDPEFRALIAPLTTEERSGLEASLKTEGCRDPLVIWKYRNVILDGHNRFDICQSLDIPFKLLELSFTDRHDAKVWIIKNQFNRRNLSPFQRCELVLKLENVVAAQAKGRMLKGKKAPSPTLGQGKTSDVLAQMANVSHGTLDKVKIITQKAQEDVLERLRSGETTINREFQMFVQADRMARLPLLITYLERTIRLLEEAEMLLEYEISVDLMETANKLLGEIVNAYIVRDLIAPNDASMQHLLVLVIQMSQEISNIAHGIKIDSMAKLGGYLITDQEDQKAVRP